MPVLSCQTPLNSSHLQCGSLQAPHIEPAELAAALQRVLAGSNDTAQRDWHQALQRLATESRDALQSEAREGSAVALINCAAALRTEPCAGTTCDCGVRWRVDSPNPNQVLWSMLLHPSAFHSDQQLMHTVYLGSIVRQLTAKMSAAQV